MTDQKDEHNLLKGSIALRVVSVLADVVTTCNNNKVFDVANLNSNNEKVINQARKIY